MMNETLIIAAMPRCPNPPTVIEVLANVSIEVAVSNVWVGVFIDALVGLVLNALGGLTLEISADLSGSVGIVLVAAVVVALKLFVPKS